MLPFTGFNLGVLELGLGLGFIWGKVYSPLLLSD